MLMRCHGVYDCDAGEKIVTSLSRFVEQRILYDATIASTYAHPSVPHSFKPGFVFYFSCIACLAMSLHCVS